MYKPPTFVPMPSIKKKSSTFKERSYALELTEHHNVPITTVSSLMKVSRNTIFNWIKQKSEIKQTVKNNAIGNNRKRKRKNKFPEIENKLLKRLKIARVYRYPVTGTIIKETACKIAFKKKIRNFAASNGWLMNFKSRQGLRCIRLVGEAGSSKVIDCIEDIEKIREITSLYDPEYIYNVDKAALFFNKFLDSFIV